ncbi:MAG: putative phosphinothricin acetyltransferase YwnH [Chlamydiae bacterium]|nr:putative phosphinothricin acetyltransferase YwnH [Chlamydiota bacterium]
MGSKPVVTMRKTTEKDSPFFLKWFEQEGVLDGFPMTDKREVEDSVRIWMLYAKKGSSITALYKKKPCGSANLYINDIEKMKHHSLFVILVDEKMRNRGIGTLLLKEISRIAKEKFKVEILHLEVYENNPALNLYKRLGFEEYGRHPRYLKDEKGNYYDKILMQKEL